MLDTVKLNSRLLPATTTAAKVVILHGLFGQCRNWQSVGKLLQQGGYEVFLLDLRNHGDSVWSDKMDYYLMANDVGQFIDLNSRQPVHLVGHSMGGKVAMTLAHTQPDKLLSLSVVDIAPVSYAPHGEQYQKIIAAVLSLPASAMSSRQTVENYLHDALEDKSLIPMILHNLKLSTSPDKTVYCWKINWQSLRDNIANIVGFPQLNGTCPISTLLLKGGRSPYVDKVGVERMKNLFPHLQVQTIANAQHLPHIQHPTQTATILLSHLKSAPLLLAE